MEMEKNIVFLSKKSDYIISKYAAKWPKIRKFKDPILAREALFFQKEHFQN